MLPRLDLGPPRCPLPVRLVLIDPREVVVSYLLRILRMPTRKGVPLLKVNGIPYKSNATGTDESDWTVKQIACEFVAGPIEPQSATIVNECTTRRSQIAPRYRWATLAQDPLEFHRPPVTAGIQFAIRPLPLPLLPCPCPCPLSRDRRLSRGRGKGRGQGTGKGKESTLARGAVVQAGHRGKAHIPPPARPGHRPGGPLPRTIRPSAGAGCLLEPAGRASQALRRSPPDGAGTRGRGSSPGGHRRGRPDRRPRE